jgi:prevent-host-death family protein
MRILAKELRTKTRLMLDAADRREQVTITYRGKRLARIVPLDAAFREVSRIAQEISVALFGRILKRE